jgi:hypothetical protein
MATLLTAEETRNRYLLYKYGITSERYDAEFARQGGVCKICGRPPKPGGKGLHVEHDHKIARLKIVAKMVVAGVWIATIATFSAVDVFNGKSRVEVKRVAKYWLRGKSVRGLVCWSCNAGLKKFYDKPEVLRAAADYIDNFKKELYTI